MKQSICYKHKPIRVESPVPIRKGICQVCNKTGRTELHHWSYEFSVKEVRENPTLALKHVSELCFLCHRSANTLRKYYEIHSSDLSKLNKLMEDALTND